MNPSSLHVAMIIHGYLPLIGGAERQLGALAPSLQERGIRVSVLTRHQDGLAREETIEGVQVYRLPASGPKVIASLRFTQSALGVIQRIHPDILHAHELFSATTTATTAKRRWGMPVVVTCHRSGPIGDVQRLKQKLFGAQRLDSFRRQVDAFVVISQEIDAELAHEGIPAERRHLIPNGVDIRRFCPPEPEQKLALRARLGLPADAEIVIFTGRLAREKRVHHLLTLWPGLSAQFPQARLLIVGSGDEEEILRQSAPAGVIFTGSMDDVVPYLQASDIYVLPSAAEGLSVAMLEAMSCGLPPLVTAVGGSPQVIQHEESGLLIPPDDLDALGAGLTMLLADAKQRAAIGQQARQRVLSAYALPLMANQLASLYRQLCRQGGSPL